jgi:hypothetical protein
MAVEIKIEDVGLRVLDYEQLGQWSNPFYDFFQFGRYRRKFSAPDALSDCFFYNLYIDYRVRGWPPDSAPAHPGIFADFFPTILRRLIGEGNTLALHVKSVDPDYFEEFNVIKGLLAARGLRYALLSDPSGPAAHSDEPHPQDLIFEWSAGSLDYVVKHWFMCPQVTIEGYIAREIPIGHIAQLYFEADTEARIRKVLRVIDLAFKLWTDNNGMFLLTDKVSKELFIQRLQPGELAPLLMEAARRYDGVA